MLPLGCSKFLLLLATGAILMKNDVQAGETNGVLNNDQANGINYPESVILGDKNINKQNQENNGGPGSDPAYNHDPDSWNSDPYYYRGPGSDPAYNHDPDSWNSDPYYYPQTNDGSGIVNGNKVNGLNIPGSVILGDKNTNNQDQDNYDNPGRYSDSGYNPQYNRYSDGILNGNQINGINDPASIIVGHGNKNHQGQENGDPRYPGRPWYQYPGDKKNHTHKHRRPTTKEWGPPPTPYKWGPPPTPYKWGPQPTKYTWGPLPTAYTSGSSSTVKPWGSTSTPTTWGPGPSPTPTKCICKCNCSPSGENPPDDDGDWKFIANLFKHIPDDGKDDAPDDPSAIGV